MKHNRSKNATLLAFCFLVANVAYGQTEVKSEKANTIKIDTRNISNEITNLFRTVAFEIRKIDFEKVGAAIGTVAEEVGREVENIEREVGDVEIIIGDRHDSDNPEPQNGYVGTAEKSKIISKTYSVGKKDKLSINNQYGKVIIHTWAKNEIKVDVQVKAYEATDGDAASLLETVTISDSRQNDVISFKTTFEKTSMNFWSKIKNGKEERRGVQVNYDVYMPAKNALDITNRYGSTIVPDFDGPVNINSTYGAFSSGKLDNPANQVKVSYGAANMGDYSNGNLIVSYGSLKLANADKVNATIKYAGANIASLTNGGTFDLNYSGGLRINEVNKNVKNLVINSTYSGVTLGIDESANIDFDVTVSYGGFNYNNQKATLVNQLTGDGKDKSWSPTKNYKGSIGKGADSRIIIKSSYGAVKFQ
ncbi:hypothetical protein [Daejeonella lutea]|uniref:Adhesin n=1 Tax=Daejeonella lutea TaxID=572036 RepID=A0A1T5DGB0_9SPHI|nr:hypothetical protein [Daejeonella lutea]SKB70716.1 hypothetical protein SAMN05661099_2334 [Daejeonella lutea]